MVPALKRQLVEKREEGKRVHQESEKLFQVFGQGGTKSGLLNEKLEQLDLRNKQVENEIGELGRSLEKAKSQSVDADRFRKALAGFGEKFNALDFLMRQRLLRLVVQRIDYNKASNEIRLDLYPLAGKDSAGMGGSPDVRQVSQVWLPGLDSDDDAASGLRRTIRFEFPRQSPFTIQDRFRVIEKKCGRHGTKLVTDFQAVTA
jgi:hypothetical protein